MCALVELFTRFDPQTGSIDGALLVERRLSDLQVCFADEAACRAILAKGDPVIYTVSTFGPVQGEGQLHCTLGMLMPGRIGAEYYLTRGHLHTWRPAAEFYIGLCGEGMILLENEVTGETRLVPLVPNSAVYVPGFTAHRTINTGNVPLTYLGIYPASAGHDYDAIAEHNFRKVVVAVDGQPTLMDREAFVASLK